MKTGKLESFFPPQTMVLCALCLVGILAFLFFVIWPSQRLSAELDRDIEVLKARIEEQKVLFPLFKNLFEKSKPSPNRELPVSPRTKLNQTELTGVPKRLQEMAAAHRLIVRDIVPEVNTLTDGNNRFMVRLTAAGQFADLRGFLIEVGSLSFFDSLEEIEVRAVEGGEEFGLKIWMARE